VPTMTLEDRLIEQLAPLGPLLTELVDAAHADSNVQHAATSYPKLRRDAHLNRVSGTVCWALVVDGLVDAFKQGRFPNGFSVNTTEPQHNAGRYAFAFPGGVFAVRREPHDDSKEQGRFLQQSFKQVTKLMDEQGAPGAETAVRVWIRIAPEGKTKLTARDRHDHKTVITLADLLEASAPPATPHPASDTHRTRVRSTLKPEQDSAAE
jgi:hypothetical protein